MRVAISVFNTTWLPLLSPWSQSINIVPLSLGTKRRYSLRSIRRSGLEKLMSWKFKHPDCGCQVWWVNPFLPLLFITNVAHWRSYQYLHCCHDFFKCPECGWDDFGLEVLSLFIAEPFTVQDLELAKEGCLANPGGTLGEGVVSTQLIQCPGQRLAAQRTVNVLIQTITRSLNCRFLSWAL